MFSDQRRYISKSITLGGSTDHFTPFVVVSVVSRLPMQK